MHSIQTNKQTHTYTYLGMTYTCVHANENGGWIRKCVWGLKPPLSTTATLHFILCIIIYNIPVSYSDGPQCWNSKT